MRRIWLLVLAAVLTISAAVGVRLCAGEVSYQGRSVSQWRLQLGDLDAEQSDRAWHRLRTGGLEALPVAIALAGPGTDRAGRLGGQLVLAMASDLGVRAVPLLLEALRDPEPWRRSWAADGLAAVQPLPDSTLEPLLRALDDRESMVRVAAVRALSGSGAWPDRVVPGLTKALSDPDAFVRQYAAKGLRAYGDAAKPARAALLTAAEDDSLEVSRAAVESLAEIGAGPEGLALLTDMLEHPIEDFTWWAAIGLGRMGKDAAPAVGALAGALAKEDAQLRTLAAEALGRIGPEAAVAVPHLVGVLADREKEVRRAAAQALGRIGVCERPVLRALEKAAAEEHDDAARQAAREALRRLRDA